MRNNLNLNPHIILPQSAHTNTSPDRLMVRHILLEIAHHGIQCLVVDGDMVTIHSEDLVPTLAACMLKVGLDVLERLIDLRVDFAVEFTCFTVPAPCPLS